MIITKLIEVGVDIDDPVGTCSDESLMYILEDKYRGKCFRECYIKSINKIVKKGECIINQVGGSAYGTIAIIFEVTAIVFIRGEILTGCLIKHINDRANLITCEADIAYVMLKRDSTFESLQVGQYITVQVGIAKYSIGSDRVAVNAIPFLPAKKEIVYQIIKSNGENVKHALESKALLDDVLMRIEYEDTASKSLRTANEKQWLVFEQLMSAYVKPPPLHPSAVPINLLTEREKISEFTFITRDNKLSLMSPVVAAYVNPPTGDSTWPQNIIVRAPQQEIMLAMLEDYCGHIKAVREMISIYSTPALLESHKNLWNIYRLNKLDKK